jgi:3-hydroxybutyryl-CoA dehydrogenase
MMIRRIGVVGAGVMGIGVAQSLVETGHEVALIDVSVDALERARRDILRAIGLRRMSNPNSLAVDPAAAKKRLTISPNLESLKSVDFVIENVTEQLELKRDIFRRIDAICGDNAVFAANTSTIPITLLASFTCRPSRVIGMHFMNPVPLKPLVEVILGRQTSREAVDAAKQLLAALGKECVVVKDSPGFVSNRVLMMTINESISLVEEKVASAEDVDRIFRGCFSHKMGPLETADLIGLDTILLSLESLEKQFKSPKFRPAPLLCTMVAAGRLGRKTGRGFYSYGSAAEPEVNFGSMHRRSETTHV